MDRVPQHSGYNARDSRVDYLRLSVTDRCNLRCTYCMPPEGVPERDHSEILSYEELAAVARAAVDVGISKVRITGGEPLVRRGVVDLVRMLAALEGVTDLSLTTNGLLLPRFAADLAKAGLRRVNVSIDSLDPVRFAEVTRGARLDQALAGLDAAFAVGFSPVKVNAVLLAGVEREVDDFAELTREREAHVRFIEHMPLDRRLSLEGEFVPSPQILGLLRGSYALEAVDGVYGHGPARYYRIPGYMGTIGFIAGVSEHFCGTCNRLRVTADGRLKNCLFSGCEVDVRPLIGRPAELRAAIAAAIRDKTYDRRAEALANARAMSEIGG
jgi:cyclic pyranopterin phosphate synthase